jgi:DNA-binding transcriptional LysR family regulator
MNKNTINQMKIRQMRIIVALADGMPRYKVSDTHHVTRSAITLSVHRAEAALGMLVFKRSKGGHVNGNLTPEGAALISKFRQILAILDDDPIPSGNVTQMGYEGSLLVSFDSTEARDKAAAAGQCRYTVFGEPV